MLDYSDEQIVNKIDEAFIRNVRGRLEQLNWNDSKLAREMKISPQYLHKMLNRGVPNTGRLASMADALGCDPGDLLMSKTAKGADSALLNRIELFNAIPALNDGEVAALLISVRTFLDHRPKSKPSKECKDSG